MTDFSSHGLVGAWGMSPRVCLLSHDLKRSRVLAIRGSAGMSDVFSVPASAFVITARHSASSALVSQCWFDSSSTSESTNILNSSRLCGSRRTAGSPARTSPQVFASARP